MLRQMRFQLRFAGKHASALVTYKIAFVDVRFNVRVKQCLVFECALAIFVLTDVDLPPIIVPSLMLRKLRC